MLGRSNEQAHLLLESGYNSTTVINYRTGQTQYTAE